MRRFRRKFIRVCLENYLTHDISTNVIGQREDKSIATPSKSQLHACIGLLIAATGLEDPADTTTAFLLSTRAVHREKCQITRVLNSTKLQCFKDSLLIREYTNDDGISRGSDSGNSKTNQQIFLETKQRYSISSPLNETTLFYLQFLMIISTMQSWYYGRPSMISYHPYTILVLLQSLSKRIVRLLANFSSSRSMKPFQFPESPFSGRRIFFNRLTRQFSRSFSLGAALSRALLTDRELLSAGLGDRTIFPAIHPLLVAPRYQRRVQAKCFGRQRHTIRPSVLQRSRRFHWNSTVAGYLPVSKRLNVLRCIALYLPELISPQIIFFFPVSARINGALLSIANAFITRLLILRRVYLLPVETEFRQFERLLRRLRSSSLCMAVSRGDSCYTWYTQRNGNPARSYTWSGYIYTGIDESYELTLTRLAWLVRGDLRIDRISLRFSHVPAKQTECKPATELYLLRQYPLFRQGNET